MFYIFSHFFHIFHYPMNRRGTSSRMKRKKQRKRYLTDSAQRKKERAERVVSTPLLLPHGG